MGDKFIIIFMSCCFGAKRKREEDQEQRTKKREEELEDRNRESSKKDGSKLRKSKLLGGKGEEIDPASRSKLIQSISMMDFTMDEPNGITHIPAINTFRYQSLLSQHSFSLAPDPAPQT